MVERLLEKVRGVFRVLKDLLLKTIRALRIVCFLGPDPCVDSLCAGWSESACLKRRADAEQETDSERDHLGRTEGVQVQGASTCGKTLNFEKPLEIQLELDGILTFCEPYHTNPIGA